MNHASRLELHHHAFSYVAEDPAICEEQWIDQAAGRAGATVHKVRPTPHELVDDLDSVARRIGAINTIRVADGTWIGGNTDANGFLHPLAAPILASVVDAAVRMPPQPGLASLRGAGVCALHALGALQAEVGNRHCHWFCLLVLRCLNSA